MYNDILVNHVQTIRWLKILFYFYLCNVLIFFGCSKITPRHLVFCSNIESHLLHIYSYLLYIQQLPLTKVLKDTPPPVWPMI